MAHPNEELIERLYDAFNRADGEAMAACYASGARFSDPVFTDLGEDEGPAMWRMLTARANQLSVHLLEHDADDDRGNAHWTADYTFRTGRRVHNDVYAEFRFRDRKIIEHRDTFDFSAWARQALGPVGRVLGRTPFLHARVRKEARADLDRFLARDRG
jgi:ketosteroid isomerase-like protein